MTYEDFLTKKDELKLSFKEFADIVGYTPDAIKKWKQKERIPKWADLVIKYLEIQSVCK